MSAPAAATKTVSTSSVRRFEVRLSDESADPRAASLVREAEAIGLAGLGVRVARVYLIDSQLDEQQLASVAHDLLASPVLEKATFGVEPAEQGARCIEIHPLPGVMDPPAQTVEMAVSELTGAKEVHASTGWRYDLTGVTQEQADFLARRLLANPVIEAIHNDPYSPECFPHTERQLFRLVSIPIRDLSDEELTQLSRRSHLFLSLGEMRTIQAHYREQGREPTDVEIETLAQTWSEHCVHKTLKSDIHYTGPANDIIDWSNRPGHTVASDSSVTIDNLLKSTVAAATHELIADGLDWALSVFVDNAGIIRFDDEHAVCVKVETHNHPSALEPYGGAATGVGGCIRDIIATGLAAKPIANTDVFCVAHPDGWIVDNSAVGKEEASQPSASLKALPAGCLHPRRILQRVVAGVRDYGNRMGVPTVSGGVYFDDRYVGNPLVYCGCVGVMPIDKITGDAHAGDHIIALGGRTGRDGLHGATFSSAELTDTHADEFSHAVQIGNPIEEKKLLDAILRARDAIGGPLFHAINDCGAGGFSSAVGEMGEELGAEVHLDRAPLKYAGLSYSEIWISEAQERMILAVPEENLAALEAICREESVELADLGTFGTRNRDLVLVYQGNEVGRLSMEFLHNGLPKSTRIAQWKPKDTTHTPFASSLVDEVSVDVDARDIKATLLSLLAHPNIASKQWIVRQYDYEVQGATVIKPMVGKEGDGPGDATVIQPVPGSSQGLAISQGLAVPVGDPAIGGDPYLMAIAAVDECVRNLVCVGADPDRIAILDNFCWPSCDSPENLASLVRASVGCYDAAKGHRTPFISGKDSLNNQFTTEDGVTIEIPPTLLITGVGIVPEISRCVTMDMKGPAIDNSDGSTTLLLVGDGVESSCDSERFHSTARAVHELIVAGFVRAAHDCSEGGVAVAVAEMTLAAENLSVSIDCDAIAQEGNDAWRSLFREAPGRYILEIPAEHEQNVLRHLKETKTPGEIIGHVRRGPSRLSISRFVNGKTSSVELSAGELRGAFFGALDW